MLEILVMKKIFEKRKRSKEKRSNVGTIEEGVGGIKSLVGARKI